MLGRIRTVRSLFLCVGYAGLLVVGLGAVLWIEGYPWIGWALIAFGVGVLYAIGYWTVPWTAPGGYRRTVRAWRDWAVAVKTSQDVAKRRASEIGTHVQALAVPQRFVAEAPLLVAQFQPDLSKYEASELDSRMRESAGRLEGASEGVARIEREALSPDERAYAEALRKALNERLDTTTRMYDEARNASQRLAAFLAETSAPARHDELHQEMKDAAADYARVMETGRAAAAARDFETLANIAQQLGPAAAQMQRCRADLVAASPVRRKS